MELNSLIGKQFKRIKYGESIWTDTIEKVAFKLEIKGPLSKYKGYKYPTVEVKGKEHWFPIDEIVILAPLTDIDRLSSGEISLGEFLKKVRC